MEHELVVATPHLGASTAEAQVKVAQEIAQSFVDAKQGKPLQGVVRSSQNPSTKCVYTLLFAAD